MIASKRAEQSLGLVGASVVVIKDLVVVVVIVVVVVDLVGDVRLKTDRVVREGQVTRVVVDSVVVVGWVLGGQVCLVEGVLRVYTGLVGLVCRVLLTYSVVVDGVPFNNNVSITYSASYCTLALSLL